MTKSKPTIFRGVARAALALLASAGLASCAMQEAPATTDTSVPERLEWHSADIGDVSIPGSISTSANDVAIEASGRDIWGYADSFFFHYAAVEGDVDIKARIDSIALTDSSAKAGVMIRDNLEADSAHAFMGATPQGVDQFIRRTVAGGDSRSTHHSSAGFPTWVRLQRDGHTVTASVSGDGESWDVVDELTVEMGEQVYVGLAVTARDNELVTQARVRSVEVSGPNVPGSGSPVAEQPEPPEAPEEPEQPEQPEQPEDDGYVGAWVCPDAPLEPRYAPTLYVSTSGSDSNDGRTEERPLRTLSEAASRVGPGDVVWVRGGVYSGFSIAARGTSGDPIVFESYPGECAIVDGGRVTLSGAQHLVFRNFVLRDSGIHGIALVNADDNEISHIRTHDHGQSGVAMWDSDRNLFRYIIAHDNYDAPGGGDADGISVSSGYGNRIEGCVLFRNSDDGLDTWQSNDTVIDRCVSFENGFQGGNGMGFKLGGNGTDRNIAIRRSIAFGNKTNGFETNSGVGVEIDQVTAFANGAHGLAVADARIRNSLSFRNEDNDFMDRGDNTEVSNSWNVGISDARVVSVDPLADGFMSLSSDSAAIDAGEPIGYSYSGPAPDLGALQRGETIESLLGTGLREALEY